MEDAELAIILIFFLGGWGGLGWLYASVAYSTKPEILLKNPQKFCISLLIKSLIIDLILYDSFLPCT